LGRILFLLTAIVSLGFATAAAAEPKPIDIVYDTNENPPFTYGVGTDVDARRPGFIVELVRAAAEHSGIPITLTRVPWARGLELVRAGDADGIFMSSYTEERLSYGVYPMKDGRPDPTRRLTDMSYWFYVRKNSGVTWDGKTLANLHTPIGATTGYAIVPLLEKLGFSVEPDPNHLRNLRRLESGEIDAYAELQAHIDWLIRDYPDMFQSIVKLEPAIRTVPYYLMFSKTFYAARPTDAERFWDAIGWVNEQAAFQDMIRAKYSR